MHGLSLTAHYSRAGGSRTTRWDEQWTLLPHHPDFLRRNLPAREVFRAKTGKVSSKLGETGHPTLRFYLEGKAAQRSLATSGPKLRY